MLYGDGEPADATQTGNDKLYGDGGDDMLYGGPGSDELHGGNGTNRLEGGDGTDKLVAEGAGDTLNGGKGNDIIELNTTGATIEFSAGDGSDAVQFDKASGTYTLKLLDLNPADIQVLAGGFDVYYPVFDPPAPRGVWYQFLTIKAGTGDQITFLENGLDGTFNIGPTDTAYPISYNRGYVPGQSTYPSDEGQLDAIVFADGTTWDQATIWSHLSPTETETWAYPVGTPGHPQGYGDYTDATFLPHVQATYLQAFTDFAAANPPPPSAIPVGHEGGPARFGAIGDLACWP